MLNRYFKIIFWYNNQKHNIWYNILAHTYESKQPVSLNQLIFKIISFHTRSAGNLQILTENAPNWIVVYITSNDVKCGHKSNMFAGEGRAD